MVGGDEHAVAQQAELPVGMAGCGHELPPVDRLAGLHQGRIRLIADERGVERALLDQLARDAGGCAVAPEPLHDPVRPVRVPPDELALRVVEGTLMDGRTGEGVEVGGRADMIGVEVGHDDARHVPVDPFEL